MGQPQEVRPVTTTAARSRNPGAVLPRGFSWRLFFVALLSIFLPGAARASYRPVERAFTVEFTTGAASVDLAGENIRGRVWADFSRIAPLLGATRRSVDGGELWSFDNHDVFFWKDLSRFRVRDHGEKRWKTETFERNMYYDGTEAMVPLSALPALCRRSFSFHRQRHTLSVESLSSETGRRVPARHERRDGQDWISLEDTAKALTIVIINSQPNHFRLVMPDFTIQEIRTGDTSVFEHNVASTRLPDPVLLFDGSPFLTVRALKILLGTDLAWDAADGSLVVPSRYGRLADAASGGYELHYRGYDATPPALRVESFSAFYQEPEPTYATDNPDVYESVRDLMTDQPINHPSSVDKRMNGTAVASLDGNTGGIPFGGRGAFEKIGGSARVVNGSLRWGFPVFEVEGGREYQTFGGLNGQFNAVNGVSLSHSNDTYGDGDINPEFTESVGYGQHDFEMFLSTSAFSQTVHMNQRFVTAGAEASWTPVAGQRIQAKLNQYAFSNEAIGVSASFFDADLLKEIFGNDFSMTVDNNDAAALTKTVLSAHHDTTLLHLDYGAGRNFELTNTLGVSRYEGDRGAVVDTDGQTRMSLGGAKHRLEVSYERAGPNYRSIGDPSRYQDRHILRVAPQLLLAKPWRVIGEVRREDNGSLRNQGVAPFTNTYSSLTNLFTFKPLIARATLTDFDSTLYGRQLSEDLNFTKPLGRDSLEFGGGRGTHRLSTGNLFRRSETVRAGYQILRPGRRFSVGEDYTWNAYPLSRVRRHETLTTLLAEMKSWRALIQYSQAPKNYLLTDVVHVGYVSIGRRLSDKRLLNFFYSSASERSNFSRPDAWRTGIEMTTTFE